LRGSIASNKANAVPFAANVLSVIEQIRASGATSLRVIAKTLNARGIDPAPDPEQIRSEIARKWHTDSSSCQEGAATDMRGFR
jgi:hypothetical protein